MHEADDTAAADDAAAAAFEATADAAAALQAEGPLPPSEDGPQGTAMDTGELALEAVSGAEENCPAPTSAPAPVAADAEVADPAPAPAPLAAVDAVSAAAPVPAPAAAVAVVTVPEAAGSSAPARPAPEPADPYLSLSAPVHTDKRRASTTEPRRLDGERPRDNRPSRRR